MRNSRATGPSTSRWASTTTPRRLTKTGTYIIFTNAAIIGKGDQQQKAVGLGVTAVAMENTLGGQNPVADEYWFDAPSA